MWLRIHISAKSTGFDKVELPEIFSIDCGNDYNGSMISVSLIAIFSREGDHKFFVLLKRWISGNIFYIIRVKYLLYISISVQNNEFQMI
jgi:hypothetical protein